LDKAKLWYNYSHTGGFCEHARIHAKNLAWRFVSLPFA